jgi:hypothetical protein
MTLPSWLGPLAAQLWSFVAVALAVNALGSVSKRIADKMGWRQYRRSDVAKLVAAARASSITEQGSGDIPLPADASWYDVTVRVHPLVIGALFGLLPLPTLTAIEEIAQNPDAGRSALLAARCAWFCLAGALSGQVYEAVKFAFTEGRHLIGSRLGALFGAAPAPPAAPTVAVIPTTKIGETATPALADELEPADRTTPDLSSNEDR